MSKNPKIDFLANFSRRHFLLGAGKTAIAVPFLPSYASLMGQSMPDAQPMRFISFGIQNGYHPAHYWPMLESGAFSEVNAYTKKAALPEIISPILDEAFKDIRQYVLLTEHIDYLCKKTDHSTSHQLTCVNDAALPPVDLRYESIDNYIATQIYGAHVPVLPMLNVNTFWYYRGDGNTLSRQLDSEGNYRSPARTWNTAVAWERLFGSVPQDEVDAARRQSLKLSVADATLESYKRFKNHPYFSAEDKKALAEHIEQLDDLEKRIANTQAMQCSLPPKKDIPYKRDVSRILEAGRVMVDLFIAGFKCDITRVVNFDWRPNTLYRDDPAIAAGHHDLSHRTNASAIEKEKEVHRQAFSIVSYMIERLAAEGLIDSTIGFVTNEIGSQSGGGYGTPENLSMDRNHSGYGAQTMIFGSPSKLNTGHIFKYNVGPKRGGRWTNVQGAAYNELLITVMAAFGVPPSAYEKPGVVGFGDYRGDQYNLINVDVVSPPDRRGKPLAGVLKT